MARRFRRRGFSLLELIATVAVLSILAAAVVPGTIAYLTRKRVEDAAAILSKLENAIATFRTNPNAAGITFYPSRLSHLTRAILSTDLSSCTGIGPATPATTYAAKNTVWLNLYEGPYYKRTVSSNGLPIGIGEASDTLFRTSAKLVAGFLQIKVPFVSFEDAEELNDFVDGSAEASQPDRSNILGKIRWGTPAADESVTLTYNITLINTGTGC